MQVCEHLKTILDHELSIGNKIKEISTAWSNAKLTIDLEKPIDIGYVNNNVKLENFVKYWENKDTHYLLQKGFFCDKCKHSIAGGVLE